MAMYRKKPVVIEAIQWDGKNQREMFDFLTNGTKENRAATLEEDTFRIDLVNGGCQVGNLIIKTLEGELKASVGDFIIKGVSNEFYPCKSDIFAKTYDLVMIEPKEE